MPCQCKVCQLYGTTECPLRQAEIAAQTLRAQLAEREREISELRLELIYGFQPVKPASPPPAKGESQ